MLELARKLLRKGGDMSRSLRRLPIAVTLAALLVASASMSASAVRAPSGVVGGVTSLDRIACPDDSRCVAAGTDTTLEGKGVVISVPSGAAKVWSGAAKDVYPEGLACATATKCVLVTDDKTAKIDPNNGVIEPVSTLPTPAIGIYAMGSVACPTPTDCYAAGFVGNEETSQAVIVHLNSDGTLLGTIDVPSGSGIGSIVCVTSARCYLALADRSQPEKIVALDNGHLGAGHALADDLYVQTMACFGDVTCYALVGTRSGLVGTTNELLSIDPTTGSPGRLVVIGNGFSNGDAIACESATKCVIVGFRGTKPVVVDVTNGKVGKPTTEPGTSLSDVACTHSKVCYAVGQSRDHGIVERL
jgi:hypothetical protein